jgi:hypothetical protein
LRPKDLDEMAPLRGAISPKNSGLAADIHGTKIQIKSNLQKKELIIVNPSLFKDPSPERHIRTLISVEATGKSRAQRGPKFECSHL